MTVDYNQLKKLLAESIAYNINEVFAQNTVGGTGLKTKVPVGISAHHLHLSQNDADALFGEGYKFSMFRPLTQPEQFVTDEFVDAVSASGATVTLRVLGPTRKNTQVEITRSDARHLGIDAPVRGSGDLEGTPGCLLRTKIGKVSIGQGVIIADRHLHLTALEAIEYGLSDGEKIRIVISGERAGVMDNVTVRAGEGNALDLHLDTDDANAFALTQGQMLDFEKKHQKE